MELLEILRGEDDRSALVSQSGRGLPEPPALAGIERGRGLVQQQHARIPEQREGDVHALPIPDGKCLRRTIGGDVETDEQPLGAADGIAFAFQAREQLEVLAGR